MWSKASVWRNRDNACVKERKRNGERERERERERESLRERVRE